MKFPLGKNGWGKFQNSKLNLALNVLYEKEKEI